VSTRRVQLGEPPRAGPGWQARLLVGVTSSAGALLACLVGTILGVRRAHVVSSMRTAGIAQPERTARRMYRALGRGVFELIALSIAGRRALRHALGLEPWELAGWRALNSGGRVMAVAHTGNWDLVACAVAQGIPLTVVTKHLSIRWLDGWWQGLRKRYGVNLVPIGRAWGAGRDALRRGELVAMLIDQAPVRSKGTTRAPFLGRTARVDLAPALLAMRARVPLVGAFPKRLEDGRLTVELGPVLVPPARASRPWAEAAMRELTAALDDFVRRHPEQWLWMHRRWKPPTPRPGRGPGGSRFPTF
jgi:KDO2-lipid IV(A) lauroyltransferase